MKFDNPATRNPIDQLKVVGKPVDRVDGPLKATGTAQYANDRHDVAANQAHGYIVGSAISKGRIVSIDVASAKSAPGVVAIVTAEQSAAWAAAGFSLFSEKPMRDDLATAYDCRGFACRLPVTDPLELTAS